MTNIIRTSYVTLIVINVAVFMIAALLNLFGVQIADVLMLSSDPHLLLLKPWTLVTYMITQFQFVHILCNMLWLYFFGRIICEYHGDRHTYYIYLIAGLTGGLSFLLLSIMRDIPNEYLIGSSAAVLGIMTAATILKPNLEMRLLILGEVKLKWIFLIAIIIIFLGNPRISNSDLHSEDVSHICGMAAGAIYAILLKKGLLTYKRKKFVLENNDTVKDPKNELNRLLDKVRQSGYASLSAKEKRTMVELSKQLQQKDK